MEDKFKTLLVKALAIFSAFVTILLVLLFYFGSKRLKNLEQTEQLYIVATDSLKLVRNELGQQKATIEVLQSDNATMFISLASKDNDIIRLQNLVKRYKKENGDLNTALILSNETNIHLEDSIRNLILNWKPDPTTGILYPTYTRPLVNDWYSGNMTMGLDTTSLDIKIKNDYDITIGNEKVSLFKKKYYANITNLNPDTETKVMKVYQKKEVKTKIITFKDIVDTGIGVVIGYLLFNN